MKFVSGIFVFVLLACLMSMTVAAPTKGQNQKRRNQKAQNSGRTKHLGGRNKIIAEYLNVSDWANSCGGDEMVKTELCDMAFNDCTNLKNDTLDLIQMNIKHISNIDLSSAKDWKKGAGDLYENLSEHPRGNISKWHKDMQLYVGTLSYLRMLQTKEDITNNQIGSISETLETLTRSSKELLCQIEILANATSQTPRFYGKPYMREHIKLRNYSEADDIDQIMIINRYNIYLNRFQRRITNFSRITAKAMTKELRRNQKKRRINKKKPINKKVDSLQELEKPPKGKKKLPKLSRQGRMIIVQPQ